MPWDILGLGMGKVVLSQTSTVPEQSASRESSFIPLSQVPMCPSTELTHLFWVVAAAHGQNRLTTAFLFCTVPCKLYSGSDGSDLILLCAEVYDCATLRTEKSGCSLHMCIWHSRPLECVWDKPK